MKKAALAVALAAGFLLGGAIAQTPPDVVEKVPQVRTYKFFITENQIVVVSPQNTIADMIK